VPSRARPRVLVADDDALVRRWLCRSLRFRYDVAEAGDGTEVIARVEAGERFDVVGSEASAAEARRADAHKDRRESRTGRAGLIALGPRLVCLRRCD
jgi:CheY-like chemotaxis protein